MRQIRPDPFKLVGSIWGSYELLEFIGAGGMGAVYRAQNRVTEGIVALKVLRPDLALQNPEMRTDFFEEAKKTAKLNHPNIIKATDAGECEGVPFLVMDWLAGHTLEQEIAKKGWLRLDRVTTLLERICEAVAFAHSHRILHRDLKPSNIMLVKDHRQVETIKIVDFGIAKALDATVGRVSRVMGAPYYASPEQLTALADIDERSDIYSLGVMLYQMLTGQLPFQADSIDEVIHQHCFSPPPSLRKIRSEIPEKIENVVLVAMAKRPEDRYPTVTDLARAFRRASSTEIGVLGLRCVDPMNRVVEGANIYFEGQYAGQTDKDGWWVKGDLPAREYKLEVEYTGYQRWTRQVKVQGKRQTEILVELSRIQFGGLMLYTNVAGSEVLVNEENVGETDQSGTLVVKGVPSGTVSVEVRHKRRGTVVQEVEVYADEVTNLELTLPRRAIWLFIRQPWLMNGLVTTVLIVLLILFVQWMRNSNLNTKIEEVITQGNQTYIEKNYDEAKKNYWLALSLNPKEKRAFVGLGDVHTAQDDLDDAEAQYKQAILVDAQYKDAHIGLGNVYYYKSKYPAAIAEYKLALKIDPKCAKAYYGLGNVYSDQDELDEATTQYNRALTIDRRYTDVYIRLGNVYYYKNMYEAAIAEYKRALMTDPKYAKAFYNLGVCYIKMNDRETAREQLKALSPLDTDLATVLSELISSR